MTRQTSAVAYNTIMTNGLLFKRRMEAYQALYYHGPCTASELSGYASTMRKNDLSSRLTELVALGVVYEVCERACQITGQVVLEFDVTANLPSTLGLSKKVTKLDIANERIKTLELELATMRRAMLCRSNISNE
jgi:hypothetical protein